MLIVAEACEKRSSELSSGTSVSKRPIGPGKISHVIPTRFLGVGLSLDEGFIDLTHTM